MKKVTFSITVVVLLAMIVGLIVTVFQQVKTLKNTNQKKKQQLQQKKKQQKQKQKRKKIVNVFIVLAIALPWEVNLLVTHLI